MKRISVAVCFAVLLALLPARAAARDWQGTDIDIKVVSNEPGNVRFEWNHVGGYSKYTYYLNIEVGGETKKQTTTAPECQLDIAGNQWCTLIVYGGYDYLPGSIKYLGEQSTFVLAGAPTGLRLTGTTADSVSLAWDHQVSCIYWIVYNGGDFFSDTNSCTISNLKAGTTYDIDVYTHNDGGNSTTCASISATTNPAAPSNLRVTNSTGSAVTLQWDKAEGAEYYQVYRTTNTQSVQELQRGGITETTWTDTNIKAGQTYHYWVCAVKGGVQSAKTGPASTAAGVAAPDKPSGLTAVSKTSASVVLTWSAAKNAQQYEVLRSDSQSGAYTTVRTVSTLTYTDTGLQPDTTYYYQLRAVNGSMKSAESAVVQCRTLAQLKAPGGLRSGSVQSSSFTLSWDAVSGAESYRVYASDSLNGSYSQVAQVKEPSAVITGLEAGSESFYQVAAVRGDEESEKSAALAVKTLEEDTGLPALTITGEAEEGGITISWQPMAGAAKYLIYRTQTEGGEYTLVATVPGSETSWTDTGVEEGVRYWYMAYWTDSEDTESPPSNVLNLNVPAMMLPEEKSDDSSDGETGALRRFITLHPIVGIAPALLAIILICVVLYRRGKRRRVDPGYSFPARSGHPRPAPRAVSAIDETMPETLPDDADIRLADRIAAISRAVSAAGEAGPPTGPVWFEPETAPMQEDLPEYPAAEPLPAAVNASSDDSGPFVVSDASEEMRFVRKVFGNFDNAERASIALVSNDSR